MICWSGWTFEQIKILKKYARAVPTTAPPPHSWFFTCNFSGQAKQKQQSLQRMVLQLILIIFESTTLRCPLPSTNACMRCVLKKMEPFILTIKHSTTLRPCFPYIDYSSWIPLLPQGSIFICTTSLPLHPTSVSVFVVPEGHLVFAQFTQGVVHVPVLTAFKVCILLQQAFKCSSFWKFN